jgi:hypothetical protein
MSQEPRTEQSVKTLVDQARMASSDTGPLLSKLADTVEELSNECFRHQTQINLQKVRIAFLLARVNELRATPDRTRG